MTESGKSGPNPSPGLQGVREALVNHWGYQSFRQGQAEVITDVLAGKDVLAVMPTGGGKSLLYQLPALVQDGITVVVSPLIALMDDQVSGLRDRGIRAECVHSGLSHARREHAWNAAEHGGVVLLFVSPETLLGELFRTRAPRLDVSRIVVDEAHCISEWGHDFRPSYTQIPKVKEILGDLPITAVTATATPRVRADIKNSLAIKDAREHVLPIDRPNIEWHVFRETHLTRRVDTELEGASGQVILYAGTRANAEAWSAHFSGRGITSRPYHAGLDSATRSAAQADWASGRSQVICATSAFGMGVDNPHVRLVLHTMMPPSIESYYQEAGRAGRDGAPARAVLVAPPSDNDRLRAWSRDQYPKAGEVRDVYRALCDTGQVAVGTGAGTLLSADFSRIGSITGLARGRIEAGLSALQSAELLRREPGAAADIRVRMSNASGALERAAGGQTEHAVTRTLASALLRSAKRTAPGGYSDISLAHLENVTGLTAERIYEGLHFFRDRGLVEDVLGPGRSLVELTIPRSRRPDVGAPRLRRLRRRAQSRAEDMITYASTMGCRRQVLLTYFGERAPERCGACDTCLAHRPRENANATESAPR